MFRNPETPIYDSSESSTPAPRQTPPIFSYTVRGDGTIHAYAVKTQLLNRVFITLDDVSSEWVWGSTAFRKADSVYAYELVLNAYNNVRSFDCSDEDNPFYALLKDTQAMEELGRVIVNAFSGGEG